MSAIDWSSYPEPWRTIGPEFADEAAEISRGGYVPQGRRFRPRHAVEEPALLPWSKGLGERLRELRKSHQLTQVELARKLRVSERAICLWETARSNPKRENRAAMQALLGVDI